MLLITFCKCYIYNKGNLQSINTYILNDTKFKYDNKEIPYRNDDELSIVNNDTFKYSFKKGNNNRVPVYIKLDKFTESTSYRDTFTIETIPHIQEYTTECPLNMRTSDINASSIVPRRAVCYNTKDDTGSDARYCKLIYKDKCR